MIKYVLIFILFLSKSALAQPDSVFKLTRAIEGDIADFAVDNLGNIYVLNGDNQLKKLDPHGDSLAVYNEVSRYGNLFSVDVTNPLKILLYYKEFATIVMVDRFLNIRNTIDLRNLNIFQARAVGLAYDNNTWVYDEQEARLKKIGDDGSLIDQTVDLRTVLDSVPEPSVLFDQGGSVYLYDTAKGIYIFDHYGAFKKHLPYAGWKDFYVIDQNILGRTSTVFIRFVQKDPDVQQENVASSLRNATKIRITPTGMYVLHHHQLDIYSRR